MRVLAAVFIVVLGVALGGFGLPRARKDVAKIQPTRTASGAAVPGKNRRVPAEQPAATACNPRTWCNRGSKRRSPVARNSVELALRWLARHQAKDGSWGDTGCAACDTRTSGSDANPVDAGQATSLALLALVGAGYTPQRRTGYVDPVDRRKRLLGESVQRGIKWLIDRQQCDGMIGAEDGSLMVRQALATLALAEAFERTMAVFYRRPAQRAVDFLEASRASDGGWGRVPHAPTSDPVVTRRVLRALAVAREANLDARQPETPFLFVELFFTSDDLSALEDERPISTDDLLEAQQPTGRGCREGSFDGPDGLVCETAKNALRLELAPRHDGERAVASATRRVLGAGELR